MSATAPNHDPGLRFAGTDLPAAAVTDGFHATVSTSLDWGRIDPQRIGPSRTGVPGNGALRTDLQRLAAAVEALTRPAPGKPEGTLQSGLYGGLASYIIEAEARTKRMREAITQGRFCMVYQPVVSLTDRSVQHFEALLRPIQSASAPQCTPQEFVTFAEAAGLVEELDLAVLAKALAALRAAPDARVAVNFSGLSVQSRRFQERALTLIGGHLAGCAGRASPSPRLLIELTETAEIVDFGTAATTLERLRAAGVPVCLDDFGAGPATFHYLQEFRFDFVKIDGAYVRAAASGGQPRCFVAAMRDLAHSVGAQVIAERIETEAEALVMAELGVEFGQGWLFGRPGQLPGLDT